MTFSATNVTDVRGVLDSACQIHTPKGEHFYIWALCTQQYEERMTSHCFSGSFGDKNAERLHRKKMVGKDEKKMIGSQPIIILQKRMAFLVILSRPGVFNG
jgi:hypothetical protein